MTTDGVSLKYPILVRSISRERKNAVVGMREEGREGGPCRTTTNRSFTHTLKV